MKELQSVAHLDKELKRGRKAIVEVYLPTCHWSREMLKFLKAKEDAYPDLIYLKVDASKDNSNDTNELLQLFQMEDNRRYPVTLFFLDRNLWDRIKGGPSDRNIGAFNRFFVDFVNAP